MFGRSVTNVGGDSLRAASNIFDAVYRGADKSLDRPGRKQATATEDFDSHISYL